MASGKIDFSRGPMWRCILAQAVPLTVAQLVQLLYNVVDRIYIGHIRPADTVGADDNNRSLGNIIKRFSSSQSQFFKS